MATLNAIRDKDARDKKFFASLQGIDLEDETKGEEDIASLSGYEASQEGFGIGFGLGYVDEG